jgi:hypothetical protein
MKAIHSGQSPPRPMASRIALIPVSCSAMYGRVATMPVIATSSASIADPCRPRTKSAAVA